MALSYSRQLLVFAVPTITVLLSYFWFKRKRSAKQSDPGESPISEEQQINQAITQPQSTPIHSEAIKVNSSPCGSPERSPRILSTPSTPIDIIIPRELRSHKTSPVVISDEDLDIEIEKIKSMRSYSSEQHMSRISGSDTCDSTHGSQKLQRVHTPKAKKSNPITMPAQNGEASTGKKSKNAQEKKKQQAAAVASKMSKVEDKLNNLKISQSGKEKDKREQKKEKEVKQPEKSLNSISPQPSANGDNNESENHTQEDLRQSSERDSANHSPADVMLASPSLSCISDNHSEGSSDSGKGGSDVATPPSRTPAGDSSMPLFYEFTIPQTLVGKLIGRFGTFVTEIKEKSRAHVILKKHPTSNKLKLCALEGSQSEIDKALKMIRERFPLKKYPEITLEQVALSMPIPSVPITSDHLYSKLVEGVNNDTIVSCMVTPGHLFLQQPTHPSYPHLQVLSRCMTMCYNRPDAPALPKPILENTICVSNSAGEWYRTMIISTDETNDTSYVTFLDYGGYAIVSNSQMKQIRGDFLLLPFQAAECYLANIKPAGNDDAEWCDEAYKMVADLTKGALVLTQIAEYTETGIPLVLMYILIGPQEVVFLNDELVKRGFADYVQPTFEQEQHTFTEEVEGAVGGVLA